MNKLLRVAVLAGAVVASVATSPSRLPDFGSQSFDLSTRNFAVYEVQAVDAPSDVSITARMTLNAAASNEAQEADAGTAEVILAISPELPTAAGIASARERSRAPGERLAGLGTVVHDGSVQRLGGWSTTISLYLTSGKPTYLALARRGQLQTVVRATVSSESAGGRECANAEQCPLLFFEDVTASVGGGP